MNLIIEDGGVSARYNGKEIEVWFGGGFLTFKDLSVEYYGNIFKFHDGDAREQVANFNRWVEKKEKEHWGEACPTL